MKRISALLVIGVILLSMSALVASGTSIKIGICQIVEHPALDAVRQGVIDSLTAAGYVEGADVTYLLANAQGDMGTALSIAQDFKSQNVDLVVAIATPTAQAAAQVFAGTDTPIIYAAVTDPVAAGLVLDDKDPTGNGNVTGTSDLIPVASDIALLKELSSKIKKIGMVYNPGEANSVVLTDLAVAAAKDLGVTIVKAVADTSANVPIAAQSLIGRVDALYVTTDNTVVSAIASVVGAAEEGKIPFLVADPTSIGSGVTLATGFDYYEHGLLTGSVVQQILNGKKTNEIPVTYQSKTLVVLDLDAAAKIGLTFPQSVIDKAGKIFYGGTMWERAK
ncbi:ABC transporter substrate-binding protein [Candidatus Bipolaricaulota bacterium]|nr:ABC transporter substrate-binding protein [Candidatus Bipolaricaulota bacterium]